MFTHFGISGPLVLSASSYIDGDCSDYALFIDLKPGLDPGRLDARLLRDWDEMKNRAFVNSLDRLLPPCFGAGGGFFVGDRCKNAGQRSDP